ncbi:P-loop containing nucleoside triphosphate hydrolase protein [Lophiotrema nucula]|uniref:P-loop containing nucleoside triphosphate hydrolase protein n=1 Tax=Lophiotrema nucula TaxID=690887 RepID=A0A6A5ZQ54_9PLEO|nr:P-loop containing nucleoside triphosphate hydrolase protein [Lophiotrema nucula]
MVSRKPKYESPNDVRERVPLAVLNPFLPPPPPGVHSGVAPPPPPPREISAPEKSSRIRTVITRWNERTSKYEDTKVELAKPTDTPTKAATYRQQMDADNEKRVEYEELVIHSQALKDLIADVDMSSSDVVRETSLDIIAQSPFYSFVWNWDRYTSECEPKENDTVETKEARNALIDLLELIRTSYRLESYFRIFRDLIKSNRKIKFEYLWTLFSHGAKVYARSYMNELQMFQVRSCPEPPHKRKFSLILSAFDWDGSQFTTYSYDFHIKEFSGEKPISSLEVFPIEYYEADGPYDDTQLQLRLKERALVTPSGLDRLTSKGRPEEALLAYSESDGQELEITSIDIRGKQNRIIIHNYAFLKSERNTMKRGDMSPLSKKIPFPEMHCPCGVYRELREPFWDELQLEQESKDLLMAYVKYYKTPGFRKLGEEADTKAFDVIEGKGQGLVILLHGLPGVGKTLTAETITLATGRSLLAVSVAEIGVEAHEAERKLTDIFGDAARWEAVLLMDEADVFVEVRQKGELGRNALVAVLLRCLEYYEGIIILTTNRVRSLDAAMQSRIHLLI